jgi:Arc/MetJ family transcription regulator
MSRDYIRIRANTEREKVLERAKHTLGTDKDSEAIERALRHTVQSAENLENLKRNITPEQAEELSTDELRLVMYPQVKK